MTCLSILAARFSSLPTPDKLYNLHPIPIHQRHLAMLRARHNRKVPFDRYFPRLEPELLHQPRHRKRARETLRFAIDRQGQGHTA